MELARQSPTNARDHDHAHRPLRTPLQPGSPQIPRLHRQDLLHDRPRRRRRRRRRRHLNPTTPERRRPRSMGHDPTPTPKSMAKSRPGSSQTMVRTSPDPSRRHVSPRRLRQQRPLLHQRQSLPLNLPSSFRRYHPPPTHRLLQNVLQHDSLPSTPQPSYH